MPPTIRSILAFIVLLITIMLSPQTISAQQYADSAASDSLPAYTTDDGPHVFWQDDTTAVVFYFCDGDMIGESFTVVDSLTFSGLCTDSSREYHLTSRSPDIMPDQYANVSRILAVSDIHGEYQHLLDILTAAGVVDQHGAWSWGDGHLVIVGDVCDRGTTVTECLWLIKRLEREAAGQGGAVHMLLGNHEVMVIRGDLRYVHERYIEGIGYRSRVPVDELFGADTELGRWLRTRHTLLRLNSTLFIHGGVTPNLMWQYGTIDSLNVTVRSGLDYSAPRLFFSPEIRRLYFGHGPLWYRGYIYGIENQYEAATGTQIDSILAMTGTRQIVVGHSEQDSICTYHDGRVIAVDVDVEALGGLQALLYQDSAWFRVHANGDRTPLAEANQ